MRECERGNREIEAETEKERGSTFLKVEFLLFVVVIS